MRESERDRERVRERESEREREREIVCICLKVFWVSLNFRSKNEMKIFKMPLAFLRGKKG